MSLISDVINSTKAIIKGMSITLSQIPKEKWTVQYPDVPVTVQPRYRGQHLLHVDEIRQGKMRGVLSVRGGVSVGLHLYRSRKRSATV